MATSNVEEFQPTIEWDHDQTFDTLLVFLPGFKKEQLTIQITSSRKLRVSGERQNADKRSRFRIEISIPSNLDSDKVGARFDNGILYVKFPKVIGPAEPHTKPPATASEAPMPTSESPSQKKDQKTNAPSKGEKPDKPKHGDTTPKMLTDEKQDKEGSRKKRTEEEKKPKGAKEPDKGKKPDDDDAQKRAAEKERKKLEENAADISETGPSEKKEAPVKKPSISKDQEGEERRKNKRKGNGDSENDMKFPARMEQPRKLINSIVVVLLVLMLGLYLKNAFRSFVGRQSDLPNPQV